MGNIVMDWTLNIGAIIQIAVIAVGGLGIIIAMRGDVASFKEDITDMKNELKELREVFTRQVDHDGRLLRAEQDIRNLREEIKELRHGEGFVFPLGVGQQHK